MRVAELETPALLIDLDVMDRNLRRVAAYARDHGLRLRPHVKTHKIPALARRQIALGAVGITTAKISEAEVMVAARPPELLMAYPILGARKLERLVSLTSKTQVSVAIDSLTAARQLSEAARAARVGFGVLAELDVGLGRMGVQPGQELVEFGKGIDALPGLRLEGIAFYPGHIKSMGPDGERAIDALSDVIASAVQDFDHAGLCRDIVSGGSTPTLFHSHKIQGMNEIRPGTYIFNDRNTVACGSCSLADCAASILATVVSTARKDGLVIDGGSKTFASDALVTGADKLYGHVVDAPDARLVRMNEEHGFVDVDGASGRFRVGDRLRVIPNHVCVAVNLHDSAYGVRGDEVVQVFKVEARGKLQ